MWSLAGWVIVDDCLTRFLLALVLMMALVGVYFVTDWLIWDLIVDKLLRKRTVSSKGGVSGDAGLRLLLISEDLENEVSHWSILRGEGVLVGYLTEDCFGKRSAYSLSDGLTLDELSQVVELIRGLEVDGR
jgi:hypothetical protein